MNKILKKTYIYFVRHGAVNNPGKIWYGRMPFYGLSEEGKIESEKAAEYLLNKNINVIYSSPLLRARQTAKIIQKVLGLDKIHYSKEILEVDSSTYKGKPLFYLHTINFQVFANNNNNVIGETIEQLLNRMQKFIKHLIKFYKGKNIVVVSHGDPIMIVKAKTENLPINIESIRSNATNYIKTGGIYLLKI